MADAARELGLDLDKTKLDPNTQDALAMQRIKDRQKRATSNGHLDEDNFQKQLSMEWASLPSDKEGYSYYTRKPEDRIPKRKPKVTHQAVRDGMNAYLN